MSWTDKGIVNTMKYLRDKYKVDIFVETGTFKGLNVIEYSKHFKEVYSCEKQEEYYKMACQKILDNNIYNVWAYNDNSKNFLKWFRDYYNDKIRRGKIIFYLDAHFFVKGCKTNKERFVVLQELKALKGFNNCIIAIHDFKNGLGGITYDGVPLDLNLVKKDLLKVNPKFRFYTNTIEGCNPLTPNEVEDVDARDNVMYAWTTPRLTYRGILYCLPTKLTKEELNGLKLREWN